MLSLPCVITSRSLSTVMWPTYTHTPAQRAKVPSLLSPSSPSPSPSSPLPFSAQQSPGGQGWHPSPRGFHRRHHPAAAQRAAGLAKKDGDPTVRPQHGDHLGDPGLQTDLPRAAAAHTQRSVGPGVWCWWLARCVVLVAGPVCVVLVAGQRFCAVHVLQYVMFNAPNRIECFCSRIFYTTPPSPPILHLTFRDSTL